MADAYQEIPGTNEVLSHSAAVEERVQHDFPPELREIILYYLDTECGRNLPFMERRTVEELETVQLRVLQVAEGDISTLQSLVESAKRDWRDVLSPTLRERGLPPPQAYDRAEIVRRKGEAAKEYLLRVRQFFDGLDDKENG